MNAFNISFVPSGLSSVLAFVSLENMVMVVRVRIIKVVWKFPNICDVIVLGKTFKPSSQIGMRDKIKYITCITCIDKSWNKKRILENK